MESAYAKWNEAYGGITWNDYLLRVSRDAETGLWAKEVAEMLSKGDAAQPP